MDRAVSIPLLNAEIMSHEKEDEIRRQFLDEARDYVATLEATLYGLAGQRIDLQAMNAALRAAHSLKGGAAMMGFKFLSELAHQLEDELKILKVNPEIAVDLELERSLLAAVSCLYRVIEFERQEQAIDAAWIAQEVEPIFGHLRSRLGETQPETAASVLSIEDGHDDVIPLLFETEVEGCLQRLEIVLSTPGQPCLREEVMILAQELGGLGEMLDLPKFEQLCQSVEARLAIATTPEEEGKVAEVALQVWREAQAKVIGGLLNEIPTEIGLDQFVHATKTNVEPVTKVKPITQPVTQSITSVPLSVTPLKEDEQDITIRVSLRQLNQLQNWLDELSIDRNGLEMNLNRLRQLTRQLQQRFKVLQQENRQLRDLYDLMSLPALASPIPSRHDSVASSAASSIANSLPTEFDLLELDRYTDVHLLSQQAMETIVQLQETTEDLTLSLDEMSQNYRHLNKTAKHLQFGMTRLRMRPFSELVDRFPRALREWSAQYGKQAKLEVRGESVLLDRNILEMLQDPLMHLLRNAFDHGIETPESRTARGKSAEGVIQIQASQQGNRTVIVVRDDGEGIPIDKIRDRATQLGLDPTLLATASAPELLSLIFEPGFSTKDQVTELSGRGIGMDVVRTQLQQIRGDITIDTQEGIGTTFTLSVPVTLSTVRIVIAETNGMLLAIPSDAIAEVMLQDSSPVLKTLGGDVIDYQGQVVPLIRLEDKLTFHCPRAPHDYETVPLLPTSSVMILRQGQQMVAIHIDRCWSDQEATVRTIAGLFAMPPGFNGCTILGDGRVVALVNVAEFLHEITHQPHVQAVLPGEVQKRLPTDIAIAPTVLIVDDSVNVRRFLAATLTKAGYQVEQAKDGQEALERLEQGLRVQTIVCDIEMPRLDGFGLLTKLKANVALQSIPVMMLTSRSGEKHQRLAVKLGAEAYFSKPYNEQDLLQTLREFVDRSVQVN